MKKEKRHELIRTTLLSLGNASTQYLAKTLNVSESTIRRDITLMSEEYSDIIKIHGGAYVENEKMDLEYMFELKLQLNHSKKKAIAKKLIEFIDENDTIVVDSGTTCLFCVMEFYRREGLKVICTDIKIAEELGKYGNINTMIIGGTVRPGFYSLYDAMAFNNLYYFTTNKAILSADAFDVEKGITNSSTFEVDIKRKLIEISKERILVIDSTKFNKQLLYKVADASSITSIITNSDLPIDLAKKIRQLGIQLVLA